MACSRVGIGELRQNLSGYLRRVARGERFIVTDRREPVAELRPLSQGEDDNAAWLRRNRLIPATLRWEDVHPQSNSGWLLGSLMAPAGSG
jgi:prevent-host-death family protein